MTRQDTGRTTGNKRAYNPPDTKKEKEYVARVNGRPNPSKNTQFVSSCSIRSVSGTPSSAHLYSKL